VPVESDDRKPSSMQTTTATQDTPQEGHYAELAPRPLAEAMKRGLRLRCPACGIGKMFYAYLKVNDYCPHCGTAFHHHRADDAPPYVTIVIVAHVVGTLMVMNETFWPDSPVWLQMIIWPVLTIVLSLLLLPPIKGALIAYQWAFRMHGFEDPATEKRPAGTGEPLSPEAHDTAP